MNIQPVLEFSCCLAAPSSQIVTLQIIFLSLVHGEGEAYSCLGMPDHPNPLGERHWRLQKSWHTVCVAHPVILLKTFIVNTSVLQDPKQCPKPALAGTHRVDTSVRHPCAQSWMHHEPCWSHLIMRNAWGGVFIVVSPVAQLILHILWPYWRF